MKKSFIALMAVAALVSCNNSETIATPEGAAIGFDAPFVENATRANDLTADNIENFGVYGYVEANGTGGYIFNNQEVVKNGNAYTYSPAQYWIANAQYYFTSFAPRTTNWTYESKNAHTGVLTFNNETAAANEDLLFAYTEPSTEATIEAKPAAVAFSYKHLLSRAKFTFTNGFAAGQNIELSISNVAITNAYAEGKMNITDGETAEQWIPTIGKNTLNIPFGNVANADYLAALASGSTTHYYMIPANNATYTITFDVTLKQAGVVLDTYNRSANVQLTMQPGCSYELKASLTAENTSDDGELYPIEFTVEKVTDWANFTPEEAEIYTKVATAEELFAAVAEGGAIMLTEDITIATPLIIENNDVTIDINNKELIADLFAESNGVITPGNTDSYVFWVKEGGKLTINGEGNITSGLNAQTGCKYSIAVWAQGGKVIINDGTFTNWGEGSDLIYASAGGQIEIYGGYFDACRKQAGVDGTQEEFSALNLKGDGTNSSIIVYGGIFFGFDPANNKSENPAVNFCAPGYTTEKRGGNYYVVAE